MVDDPDAIIISIDDDVAYELDMVNELVNATIAANAGQWSDCAGDTAFLEHMFHCSHCRLRCKHHWECVGHGLERRRQRENRRAALVCPRSTVA